MATPWHDAAPERSGYSPIDVSSQLKVTRFAPGLCIFDLVSSLSLRAISPLLAPFVGSLSYHESEGGPALERILPGGRVHLMVNLHEDEFRTYHGADCGTVRTTGGAVLEGASSTSRVIDTELQRCLVSVNFRLGGAAAFFKAPLSEARNNLVELDKLWGASGVVVRERLIEATTPAARLRVMERVLLEQLLECDPPDPAIPFAASLLERGIPVSQVSSRVGLLPKTLVRRFRDYVGLSPKRFSRVRRLQRVVGSIRAPRDADWCELAAVHGYADQAHLVHDFRELTGITPTTYRPRSSEARNHVAVDRG
jgi:AraC-like DNA-binding protein